MFPVYLHPYLLLCVGSGVSTYNMSLCLYDEYIFCVIYLRYDVVFVFVPGVVAHFDPRIFIISQCFCFFQEWRHAHGMRCLGIPNTAHFANVTLIEDAVART